MTQPQQSSVRNRLLRVMSADDFALLAPRPTPRKAGKGDVLFERDKPFTTAWFMESGVGSIVATSPEGMSVENGLFGRDGFAPVALVMGGDRSAHRAFVQLPDDSFSMPAEALTEAIGRSATLHNLLLRFAQTLSTQTA